MCYISVMFAIFRFLKWTARGG